MHVRGLVRQSSWLIVGSFACKKHHVSNGYSAIQPDTAGTAPIPQWFPPQKFAPTSYQHPPHIPIVIRTVRLSKYCVT